MLDDTNCSVDYKSARGAYFAPFSLQYDGQRLTDLLLLWTKTEQVSIS